MCLGSWAFVWQSKALRSPKSASSRSSASDPSWSAGSGLLSESTSTAWQDASSAREVNQSQQSLVSRIETMVRIGGTVGPTSKHEFGSPCRPVNSPELRALRHIELWLALALSGDYDDFLVAAAASLETDG